MLRIASVVLFLAGTMALEQWQELTRDCGAPSLEPSDNYTPGDRMNFIKEGSWPWLVALVRYMPGKLMHHFCGATLLNENWMVTASQCVDNNTEREMIEEMRVIPGQRNLWKAVQTEGLEKTLPKVSRVILHEEYNKPKGSHNYDIALIKLAQPLELSAQIHPICLPTMHIDWTTEYPFVMKTDGNGRPVLFVASWGHMPSGGPSKDERGPLIGAERDDSLQIEIEMYNRTECEAKMKGHYYSDQMVCGGVEQGGKESCHGDNGGPLIQKGGFDHKWQLQGVVSWGPGCARDNMPEIYTNVMGLVPWILDTIRDN